MYYVRKKDDIDIYLNGKNVGAFRKENNHVILFKGVKLRKKQSSTQSAAALNKIDEIIKENNCFESDDEEYYIITCDIEFSSPSLAAGCILGRQADGLIAFNTKRGKKLRDIDLADYKDLITFIENEKNNPKYFEKKDAFYKLINEIRKKYPKDKIKDMSIEDYCNYTKEDCFINYYKRLNEFTVNANERDANLFFIWIKEEKKPIIAYKIGKDRIVGDDVNRTFKKFINELHYFVNNFDHENYKRNDYFNHKNLFNNKILSIYYEPLLPDFPVNEYINKILKNLKLEYNEDADNIEKNIILYNYIIKSNKEFKKIDGFVLRKIVGEWVQKYVIKNDEVLDKQEETKLKLENAKNVIYYGVPGSGKSYEVNSKYCVNPEYYVRTVFHPDYTYTDFIGQIMPISNDDKSVEYRRIEGPLTKAIKIALENPNIEVSLIIEEINRGPAAAIFGDIFQLLDRSSDYRIENEFIKACCKKFDGKLPQNLNIVATMNTSDQNVFVLDNAFKRRWEFIRVKNELKKDDNRYNAIVAKSNITWNDFYTKINEYILDKNDELLNNEDKRLGAYFVTKEEIEDVQKFGDKVLMYLWDNIARYNPDNWFKNKIRVYDELIDAYMECDKILNIFCEDLKNKFEENNNNE